MKLPDSHTAMPRMKPTPNQRFRNKNYCTFLCFLAGSIFLMSLNSHRQPQNLSREKNEHNKRQKVAQQVESESTYHSFNSTRVKSISVNSIGVSSTGVNSTGVNLFGVNLTGVNLTGVNLTGVNSTGVNSTRVKFLAVLISTGDVANRIQDLCTSSVLANLVGIQLTVIWKSDKWLPATNFQELFENKTNEFDVINDLEDKLEIGPALTLWHELWGRSAISGIKGHESCIEIADRWNTDEVSTFDNKAISPPLGLYVHESVRPCELVPAVEACELRRAILGCFGELKPVEGVLNLLHGDNLSKMNNTVGVFLQEGQHSELLPDPPLFCPFTGPSSSLEKRNLTSSNIVGFRIGRKLEAVVGQSSHVQDSRTNRKTKNKGGYRKWSTDWKSHANAAIRAMVREVLKDPNVHFFVGGGPPSAVEHVVNAIHKRRTPKTLPLRGMCGDRGESSGPSFSREQVEATGVDRFPLVACARQQLAQLIALSFTRTLIYLQRSVATDYIMAQAEARAWGGFERQIAVRDGKRLVKITRRKWAHNIYVNGVNGIKRLSSNFTELQAVKILTDPFLYKFVFVRNPWLRILEVYFDKVMKGGLEKSRYYWYYQFFARLQEPIFNKKKKRHPYVSFGRFLHFVEKQLKHFRRLTNQHILPQMDVCGLNKIKYDFVGYLEEIESEKDKLRSSLIRRERNVPFPSFINVSTSTNKGISEKQLKRKYSLELILFVEKLYSMDVNLPLNNITFQPPYVLSKVLSQARGNNNS